MSTPLGRVGSGACGDHGGLGPFSVGAGRIGRSLRLSREISCLGSRVLGLLGIAGSFDGRVSCHRCGFGGGAGIPHRIRGRLHAVTGRKRAELFGPAEELSRPDATLLPVCSPK
ncbi:hypothetical protein [Saccharopolyspora antimicrobica]|uniref:hypothetical protein n=1 Tax=Saccharopolyspora antimicrobica TaxID=455193 RepID=UPI0011608AFD|nr:hypothetical protein [Saccharopolyspora antimicrobica]